MSDPNTVTRAKITAIVNDIARIRNEPGMAAIAYDPADSEAYEIVRRIERKLARVRAQQAVSPKIAGGGRG